MKILVSKCLLSAACRWDGHASGDLRVWLREHGVRPEDWIAVCPETLGGLPTPRDPAEIQGGDGHDVLRGDAQVLTQQGKDLTLAFSEGAHAALASAQRAGALVALLKSKSPSCGRSEIYDGRFVRQLRPGDGVTSALLTQHGIRVFNETELSQLADFLADCKTDHLE